jgi:hypothetical protein
MSVLVFLAICILGCDVLLYILFQWIYGEKYRDRSRRLAARRKTGPVLFDLESQKSKVHAFPRRVPNSRTDFL